MNINSRLNQGYTEGNSGDIKNVTKTINDAKNQITDGISIANLKENTVFKGQIANITNKDVLILLDGMNQINAKLGEAVSLNIGDDLYFQVKENDGKQIVIKPLDQFNDFGSSKTIEKAIDGNGFLMTEKNMLIAKSLMNAGEPLDRATMLKVMQQTIKFPDAAIDNLVKMNKMNIPVNQGNLLQFDKYMNTEHQIVGDLANITKDITSLVSTNLSGNDGLNLIEGSNKILNILSNGQLDMTKAFSQSDSLEIQRFIQPQTGLESQMPIANTTLGLVNKEASIGVNAQQIDLSNPKLTLSEDNKKELVNILKNMDIPENIINSVISQAENEGDLLNKIHGLLNVNSKISREKLESFFESSQYREILTQVVKKEWMLDPKNMKDSDEVNNLYEKILSQTNKLMDSFSGSSSESFKQHGQALNDNIQFMNDLSQMYGYTQLPVKSDQNEFNSELFVYANKNKLNQKGGEISVLLHLDMDNLGPTDVHISLTGKNVHAKFYLADNSAVDIISDNMGDLVNQLKDRGFTLTDEVMKREEKQTNKVVEEVFESDKEQSVKRYTFDVRM